METVRLDLWAPHFHRSYPGHGMGPQCMFRYILTHTHTHIYTYIHRFGGWGKICNGKIFLYSLS